jgi:regulatory protein
VSGTITEIRRTDGDPPRLTVFVDGVEAFTVSEEVASELGLAVGRSLAGENEREPATDDERTRAREAALRLLAVRARSEGELADRLRRKGFSDETARQVLVALSDVGLVDDEAFARAWVDERVRLRPVGPRRLVQELLAKHVDRELAERVIDEAFGERTELELAMRALTKKTRASGAGSDRRTRARLHAFLVRRGFSYEVASAALKELERKNDA